MKKFMTLLLAVLLVLSLGFTFAACAGDEDEPADSVVETNSDGTPVSSDVSTTTTTQASGGNGGSISVATDGASNYGPIITPR